MKIIYTLLLCLILPKTLFNQIPPPCPAVNPPLAKTCSSACILCNLDGYTSTSTQTIQGQILPGFCTQIVHSMGYMGFVAGSTDLMIQVDVGACTQGNSIEMGIFQTDDCQNFTLVSDCNTAMFTGNAYTFSNTAPLVPGCPYFLVFDNNGPAACAFTVTVLSGSATAPAVVAPAVPSGPTMVCPGATVTYTIPPVFGACRYQWTAPSGTLINGMPPPVTLGHEEGTTVTVTWGNQGGQICVRGSNPCSQGPSTCLPVTVGQIPPTILPPINLCFGQSIEWIDGNLYGISQLLSATYTTAIGCDSTVRQQLNIQPPIVKNLGVQRLCSGDCLTVGNNHYCTPGFFQEILTAANGCDSTVNFTIQIIAATAVIAPPDTLDCLRDSIWLNGSASTPGSQFAWLNSGGATLSNNDSVLVHQPGMYRLVVTRTVAGLTCQDTAAVTVPGNFQLPALNAAGDTITCMDTLAQLFASSSTPGVTYAWSGPGGFQSSTPAPVVSVPGWYSISAHASNGCTRSDSVLVADNTANPVLALTLSDTLDCLVDSVLIGIQSNLPVTSYAWTGPYGFGASQADITVAFPGVYAVIATAPNGCTGTATVVVPADTLPPVVSATGDTLSCLQPGGNISATVLPAVSTVAWSGPQNFSSGQIDPPVSLPGIYQLIATAANGCSALATAIVIADTLPPTLTVNGATITCDLNPVTLVADVDSAGTTVAWSGPQNYTSSQLQASVSTAGIYTAVATAGNGCTSAQTAQVLADTLPPQVSASGDTLTCIQQTGFLGLSLAPAGSSVSWTGPQNFGSPLLQPQVSQPGIYTVTATAPNGCTATAQAAVIADASIPQVSAGGGTITCAQNTIVLAASISPAGSAVMWTGPMGFSSDQPTPVVNIPGLYTLLATTPNGCTASATALVAADTSAPALTVTGDTISCLQPTVTIQAETQPGNAAIAWTGPQNFTANLANPVVALPGAYTAIAILPNGCSASASIQVPADTISPQVTASAGVLTCSQLSTGLAASTTPGAGVVLSWSGPQNFQSNLANPLTGTAGIYTVMATASNGCSGQAVTEVFIDTIPPTIAASGDTINCYQGIASVSATVSPANAAFFWNGPSGFTSTLPEPGVTVGGQYNVLVTTPNGCTAQATATVLTDTTAPVVSVSGGVLTCIQNVLTLNASVVPANANVWWVGPQNFTSAFLQPGVGTPGLYTLTATGLNGCTTAATALVTADSDFPQVSATGGVITCTQVVLPLSASVLPANANISWTGPQNFSSNILNPVVQIPGTYTLTATTPAGCSATATATVQADTIPPQIATSDDFVSCNKPNATLIASTLPAGCAVVWMGPQNFSSTQLTPTTTHPGNYTITATGPNGCTAMATAEILADTIAPQVEAAAGGVLTCTQTAIPLLLDLTPGNAGVLWAGPQNFNSTAQAPLVSVPGSYSVTATGSNGCTAVASVTVAADILYPQISANGGTISCAQPLVPLTAQVTPPGGIFLWTGPQQYHSAQPAPQVSVPGVYLLTVTSANGCTTTASATVATDLAPPLLDIFGNDITCREDTALLEAVVSPAGSSVHWTGPNNFSSSLAMTTTTIPGLYTAIATGSNGCSTTAQLTVSAFNQPAWTLSLGPPLEAEEFEPVFPNPHTDLPPTRWTAIAWDYPPTVTGNPCRTCAFPVIKLAASGTVTVQITDEYGCAQTASVFILVQQTSAIYVPNIFAPDGSGNNRTFRIYAGAAARVTSVLSFRIFDRWGSLVHERLGFDPNDPQHGWDGTVRGQAAAPGVYVWYADFAFANGRKKLLKGDVTLFR